MSSGGEFNPAEIKQKLEEIRNGSCFPSFPPLSSYTPPLRR